MSNLSNYLSAKIIVGLIVAAALFGAFWQMTLKWSNYAEENIDTVKTSETSDVGDTLRLYSAPEITIINGYIDYGDEDYDLRKFVNAVDMDTGEDITSEVEIHGTVDVYTYGVYKIHYEVKSEKGIKAEKYGQVIVKSPFTPGVDTQENSQSQTQTEVTE